MVKSCIAALLVLGACAQQGIDEPADLPDLDPNYFRCLVQPVLAARCSFMACHGNQERPFQIYAEQRYRLGIDWIDYETPLTEEELEANFQLARGFTQPINLMALKPLDTSAGGRFHRGKDLYGNDDVFLSRSDAGYLILQAFGQRALADADCVPTEEVGE